MPPILTFPKHFSTSVNIVWHGFCWGRLHQTFNKTLTFAT